MRQFHRAVCAVRQLTRPADPHLISPFAPQLFPSSFPRPPLLARCATGLRLHPLPPPPSDSPSWSSLPPSLIPFAFCHCSTNVVAFSRSVVTGCSSPNPNPASRPTIAHNAHPQQSVHPGARHRHAPDGFQVLQQVPPPPAVVALHRLRPQEGPCHRGQKPGA